MKLFNRKSVLAVALSATVLVTSGCTTTVVKENANIKSTTAGPVPCVSCDLGVETVEKEIPVAESPLGVMLVNDIDTCASCPVMPVTVRTHSISK